MVIVLYRCVYQFPSDILDCITIADPSFSLRFNLETLEYIDLLFFYIDLNCMEWVGIATAARHITRSTFESCHILLTEGG